MIVISRELIDCETEAKVAGEGWGVAEVHCRGVQAALEEASLSEERQRAEIASLTAGLAVAQEEVAILSRAAQEAGDRAIVQSAELNGEVRHAEAAGALQAARRTDVEGFARELLDIADVVPSVLIAELRATGHTTSHITPPHHTTPHHIAPHHTTPHHIIPHHIKPHLRGRACQ